MLRIPGRTASDVTPEAETAESLESHPESEAQPFVPAGPELLHTGPLLADWFVRYQLDREMDRARRHGRPLSIVVLTPVPSIGVEPSPEALLASARAAHASSRSTDLVGWLSGNRILLVLPETDRDGTGAAVYRLSTEMSTRTLTPGQLRWVATTWIDGFEYQSADELLAAVGATVI